MKIILRKDYEHLGGVGEMFEVKDGYARNFLIPNGIAMIASPANIKSVEELKKQQGKKFEKQEKDAQSLSEDFEKHTVYIEMKTGDDDKLYGSVTAQMIYDKLINDGLPEFDKRKIVLKEVIKTLGVHDVDVKLHSTVSAKLKVVVYREGGSPEEVINASSEPETKDDTAQKDNTAQSEPVNEEKGDKTNEVVSETVKPEVSPDESKSENAVK